MNYYIQNESGSIGIRGQEISIPPAPGNADYDEFLAWCEAGNMPDPFVAPAAASERTAAEKLAAAGLTIDELKGLLGLD